MLTRRKKISATFMLGRRTVRRERERPSPLWICLPERLESILRSVVDYESEEGPENGRFNLEAMGFTEEEMIFFGFPPSIDGEEG